MQFDKFGKVYIRDLAVYRIFSQDNELYIGYSPSERISMFGAPPILQQTAMTSQRRQITHTAPGNYNYSVQDFVDVGDGYAFKNKNEANTVLSVIKNLQVRVQELEDILKQMGVLAK